MRSRLLESEKKFMPLFLSRRLSRTAHNMAIVPWWTFLHSSILAEHVSVRRLRV